MEKINNSLSYYSLVSAFIFLYPAIISLMSNYLESYLLKLSSFIQHIILFSNKLSKNNDSEILDSRNSLIFDSISELSVKKSGVFAIFSIILAIITSQIVFIPNDLIITKIDSLIVGDTSLSHISLFFSFILYFLIVNESYLKIEEIDIGYIKIVVGLLFIILILIFLSVMTFVILNNPQLFFISLLVSYLFGNFTNILIYPLIITIISTISLVLIRFVNFICPEPQ
jgi:hypothetical protein